MAWHLNRWLTRWIDTLRLIGERHPAAMTFCPLSVPDRLEKR